MKWTSFVLSIVAIILSGMTFYYNYWYESSKLELYVFDTGLDIVMDKDVVVDMVFTNKGNRQALIRSVRSYIGYDNVGYLYLDQKSDKVAPIIVNPREITHIKITAKLDAAKAYDFIGPKYKGELSVMEHLKGRQREVPIGITIASMDFRGINKINNIKITSVMIADNNIFMVGGLPDNILKMSLY